ncbi:hypothetical protein KY284_008485 [Solanum tuberosum]|nr:hypothetical protein KY284_008485 [Solanum tuberosum]
MISQLNAATIKVDTMNTKLDAIKIESDNLKEKLDAMKDSTNFEVNKSRILEDKVKKMKTPSSLKTAAYGHFGRDDADFTWETVKALKPKA